MNTETNILELSDLKDHPKGRCIDCWEFIPNNENMRACSCKEKKGYVTMNALRKLYCKEYREFIRPEFHDYLLKQGFKTKDILDAVKFVKQEWVDNNKSSDRRSASLEMEIKTRDILQKLEPKNTEE